MRAPMSSHSSRDTPTSLEPVSPQVAAAYRALETATREDLLRKCPNETLFATCYVRDLLPSITHLKPCKVAIDAFSLLVERTSAHGSNECAWMVAVVLLLATDVTLEFTPLYDLDANSSKFGDVWIRLASGCALRDYLTMLDKCSSLRARWEADGLDGKLDHERQNLWDFRDIASACRVQKMVIRRIVGLVSDEDLIMNPYWGCAVADALPQRQEGESLGSIILDFNFEGEPSLIRLNAGPNIASGGTAAIIAGCLTNRSRNISVVLKVASQRVQGGRKQVVDGIIERWKSLPPYERILPLFGICNLGQNQVALVTPFMHFGSLNQYLKAHPRANRTKLLIEVAEGLRHLHDIAKIVHGDLKGDNILISADESALLADFGCSTTIAAPDVTTATSIRQINTIRFSAPELLVDRAANINLPRRKRSKTTMSDVYAYGMTMYEAFAGVPPWADIETFVEVFLQVSNGRVPARPAVRSDRPSMSDHLWQLCLRCWTFAPEERPLIGDALRAMWRAREVSAFRML